MKTDKTSYNLLGGLLAYFILQCPHRFNDFNAPKVLHKEKHFTGFNIKPQKNIRKYCTSISRSKHRSQIIQSKRQIEDTKDNLWSSEASKSIGRDIDHRSSVVSDNSISNNPKWLPLMHSKHRRL